MKKLIVFGMALTLMPLSWAAFSSGDKGSTSANFLKLGVDARAVGMGEAYTAAAHSASALYWNPAGLRRVQKGSVVLMHAPYIDSSHFSYGSFAQSFKSSSFGVSVQHYQTTGLTERDTAGVTGGSFKPQDVALAVGGAHTFKLFSVGLAVKYVESKIINSAETLTFDAGVLLPVMLDDRLSLGMSASNLGGKLKYDQESEDLPTVVRTGSAYKLNDKWLGTFDIGFPKDNSPYFAFGTEVVWRNEALLWAARAGFNTRTLDEVEGFAGPSLGLGFKFAQMGLDYAFVPMGDLSLTHRVSLGFTF